MYFYFSKFYGFLFFYNDNLETFPAFVSIFRTFAKFTICTCPLDNSIRDLHLSPFCLFKKLSELIWIWICFSELFAYFLYEISENLVGIFEIF